MAKPLAEYVVSIGADGHIANHGSASIVLASNVALAEQDECEKELDTQEGDSLEDHQVVKEPKESSDGKLVIAEEIELGRVSMRSREYQHEGHSR